MSDNLRIWSQLEKTDPKHTKAFKRAGGFTGTAIKPIWSIKRLTELFGPCGEGWGMTAPVFQTVPGSNNELLVYCTVGMWHGKPDNLVYGVGGDKVVTYIKANDQYKRPERWESDDEAFKKAFTDALMNAAKQIGVGADVHMGMFDDNKYVRQVEREFAEAENGGNPASPPSAPPKPPSPPPAGPTTTAYGWTGLAPAENAVFTRASLWMDHAEKALRESDQKGALWWDNTHTLDRIRINAQSLKDGPKKTAAVDRINVMIRALEGMGLKAEPPEGIAA